LLLFTKVCKLAIVFCESINRETFFAKASID
jgi:hypothetical protein